MAMIEVSAVSKWYGQFQVLTDCTTKVEKGEVIVVCGPSGSGKSTLIKCVNGLEAFQLVNLGCVVFLGGGFGLLHGSGSGQQSLAPAVAATSRQPGLSRPRV